MEVPAQPAPDTRVLGDQVLAVIEQQPQLARRAVEASDRRSGSRKAGRAKAVRDTAKAPMGSDLPRSRLPRRASAVSVVGTRR